MTSAAAGRGLGLASLAVVVALLLSGALAEQTSATPALHPLPEPRSVPRNGLPDDPAALALLRRAADAEHRVGFKGTQFVSTWRAGVTAETSLLELTNLAGSGVIVRDAGSSARFVRRAQTSSASLDVLADAFFVRRTDDLASSVGRSATVVEAVRANNRVAARFYLDNATGLMLRREIFSAEGDLVRESAYVDLRVDPEIFVGHLPPLVSSGGRAASAVVRATGYSALAAAGWDCCVALIADRFRLDQVRKSAGSLHLSYSDGLVTASIFEQHGGLKPGTLEGFRERGGIHTRYGLMSYAVWSHDGTVYTVACETPECVDAIAAAYPHGAAAEGSAGASGDAEGNDGITGRFDRGMARMGSWLNPFD